MTSTCATPTAAIHRACCAQPARPCAGRRPNCRPPAGLRVRDAAGETRVDAAQATEYQLASAPSARRPSTSRRRSTRKSSAPTRRCTRTLTSLLEHFQQHSGPPARRPRPAARADHSDVPPRRRRARAHLGRSLHAHIGGHARPCPASLAQAREPLSAAQIAGCMAAPGGDTFQATSRQAGRCWAPTCAAPVPPSSFPAPSTPTKPPAWSARCARRRRWPPAARATSR